MAVQVGKLVFATTLRTEEFERGSRRMRTTYGRNVDSMQSKTRGLSGQLRKLGPLAAGAFAGISAGAIGRESLQITRDYSQALSTVKGVTTATERQFRDLKAEARDLGAVTRFSATQAGEGMEFLARAGFNVRESIAGALPTLRLAQAGNISLANSGRIASDVLSGFNKEVSELESVTDMLSVTSTTTNTNIEGLGVALANVGYGAVETKTPLEVVLALLGRLGDVGVKAGVQGNIVRNMMSRLVKFTGEGEEALRSLGLAEREVSLESNSLLEVLDKLAEKNITLREATYLFGLEYASNTLAVIKNMDAVRKNIAAIEDSQGATKRLAEIMDDNTNGAVLRMKSAWEELLLSLGEDNGIFDWVIGKLTDFIKGADKTVDAINRIMGAGEDRNFDLLGRIDELNEFADSTPALGGIVGGRSAAAFRREEEARRRQARLRSQDLQAVAVDAHAFSKAVEDAFSTAVERYTARNRPGGPQLTRTVETFDASVIAAVGVTRRTGESLDEFKERVRELGQVARDHAEGLNEAAEAERKAAEQQKARAEAAKKPWAQTDAFPFLAPGMIAKPGEGTKPGDKIERKQDPFTKQMQEMRQLNNEATKRAKDELERMDRRMERHAKRWKDTISYGIEGGIMAGLRGGAKGFLDYWKNVVVNSAARQFADAIAGTLHGKKGKGGLWGGVADFASGLFGFQHGGMGIVAGAGGPDSQLVSFRATPGERVSVTPPGMKMGGGAVVFNQEIHLHGNANDEQNLAEWGRAIKDEAVGEVMRLRHNRRF